MRVHTSHAGQFYSLQISILTHPRYPEVAPFVFIKATTNTSVIQPSQYVNEKGQVVMPYIQQWKSVSSKLHDDGVVHVL